MAGRQREQDDIDVWSEQWARQRRVMYGIVTGLSIQPKECVGKLNCTLGTLKTQQDGAGTRTTVMGDNGHPPTNWPEVYTGMALEVHRAVRLMPYEQQEIMTAHYVFREVKVARKCRELRVTFNDYWARVSAAKGFIRGYIASQPAQFTQPAKKREPNILAATA